MCGPLNNLSEPYDQIPNLSPKPLRQSVSAVHEKTGHAAGLRSGLLLSGLLKSGLLRSGLLQSGLLRSGLLRSGLLRSGLLRNGLLQRTSAGRHCPHSHRVRLRISQRVLRRNAKEGRKRTPHPLSHNSRNPANQRAVDRHALAEP